MQKLVLSYDKQGNIISAGPAFFPSLPNLPPSTVAQGYGAGIFVTAISPGTIANTHKIVDGQIVSKF